MFDQLETAYQQAQTELNAVTDRSTLEAWEAQYLGKKGSVITMIRSVGQLPKEERAGFGKRLWTLYRPMEARGCGKV